RFGRRGDNAEQGAEILRRGRMRMPRKRAELMISALQAAVFNEVVDRRPVGCHELMPGDLVLKHATGELEHVDDPARFAADLESFAISPTGPIFGTKMTWPRGTVRDLEREALAAFLLDDPRIRAPRNMRVYGSRRCLRAKVTEPQHDWDEASETLALRFQLPAGSYATVLIAELFPEGVEEGSDAEAIARA
ncbi:MAG: tRNA pseudouridine(13) synthase TruD, partial [Acidobacteriota bacterium]